MPSPLGINFPRITIRMIPIKSREKCFSISSYFPKPRYYCNSITVMKFVPKITTELYIITGNKISCYLPENIVTTFPLFFVAMNNTHKTHLFILSNSKLFDSFLFTYLLKWETKKHTQNNENTKSSTWTTTKMFIFFSTSSHETAHEWESLAHKRNWNYNKIVKKKLFASSLRKKMEKRNVQVGNFKSHELKCEYSYITVPSTALHDQSKKILSIPLNFYATCSNLGTITKKVINLTDLTTLHLPSILGSLQNSCHSGTSWQNKTFFSLHL